MTKKKVLAIDLNDVIRNYSDKFITLYKKNIDKKFDDYDMEYIDNDFHSAFNMSKMDRDKFMYEDFPLELFGFATEMNSSLAGLLNIWVSNLSDYDEYPEVVLMSCGEHELAIPATFFFLSRSGIVVRKMYFPETSEEAWSLADIIITANTKLIKSKPEGKVVIKITTDYNSGVESEYKYNSLNELISLEKVNKEFNEIIGLC